MFYLLNKELSFEVDVTACGCGMNSALYFISMESDDGQPSSGYTGATYGTGYCDAQPAAPGRPSCDELDIWEANSLANWHTTHPCLNGQCDASGCGLNSYTLAGTNVFMVVDRVIRWTALKGSLSSPYLSPLTEQATVTSRSFCASTSRTAALSNSRHSTVSTACLTPTAELFTNLMDKEASPTACHKE